MNDYYNLPAQSIQNKLMRVDYLTSAGPRIVRLLVSGCSENLLAETPNVHWPTPNGEYHALGGHRLWQAPEIPAKTYAPDGQGVTVHALEGGVELTGIPDAGGIQKSLLIRLDPDRPVLEINHKISNCGPETIHIAPWAITQLPPGGRIILPLPTAPFPPENEASIFWPNRHIALWPYTHLNDPRLTLADDHICLHATPVDPHIKVGILNLHGWVAWHYGDTLLVKTFRPYPGAIHPDRNTNAQAYTNRFFAEMETLGPLVTLTPGQSTEHVERWHILQGIAPETGFERIAATVSTLQ